MAALTPNRLPENASDFDTRALLQAVDYLDQIRDAVGEQIPGSPLALRENLMTLHGLLYGLLREGQTIPDASSVWHLMVSIETAVAAIVVSGERVVHILHTLREALPVPDVEPEDEHEA